MQVVGHHAEGVKLGPVEIYIIGEFGAESFAHFLSGEEMGEGEAGRGDEHGSLRILAIDPMFVFGHGSYFSWLADATRRLRTQYGAY